MSMVWLSSVEVVQKVALQYHCHGQKVGYEKVGTPNPYGI